MAMSRAATAGLGMLGGVVGLTVFLTSRGLPDYAKEAAAQTDGWMKSARAQVAAERARLQEVVAEDAPFLAERPEVKAAEAVYAERLGAIDKIEARIEAEIKPILKADKYEDRLKLRATVSSVEAALTRTPPAFSQRLADVYRVRNYKRDHASLVQGATASLQRAAQVVADPTLAAVAAQGQVDYPDAAERIQARLTAVQEKAAKIAAEGPALTAAAQAEPIDYVKVGTLAEAIQKDARAVTDEAATLRADIASLDKSSDKILVDMKQDGALCYHKYRFVEGGLARLTGWEPVSCAEYKGHEDHLGMAIYSKPEGSFESEAITVAHPPGYNYIGNPRYGRWDVRSGGQYWVWYGQYALTRDLLWGVGGYQPVRNRTWSSYRSAVKSRTPYYGDTKQYGTNGTIAQTKYKSSAFMTKRRATFAASKYRGTSGTKYTPTGSSGTRSGGTRSGSTYRANRYRSSSFGGSGK